MNEETKNLDNSIRRSKRIAAKVDEKPQLIDLVLTDLETESSQTKKKNDSSIYKKKIYKSNSTSSKFKFEETGTLFDCGLQANSIIGATYMDNNGINELCYLIKYENSQFELVLNKIAHKCCPNLVIDFLESRILFKEHDDLDLMRELLAQQQQTHLSQQHQDQLTL